MPARDRGLLVSRMQNRIRRRSVFSWAADIIQSTAGIKQEQELRKVNLLTIPIESRLVMQYRQAARRVIFLDYDGTLVPFSRIPELAIPDVPTLRHLHLLAKDPKNRVFIISGRAKDFMEEWLGDLDVFLFAEHGALQKPRAASRRAYPRPPAVTSAARSDVWWGTAHASCVGPRLILGQRASHSPIVGKGDRFRHDGNATPRRLFCRTWS